MPNFKYFKICENPKFTKNSDSMAVGEASKDRIKSEEASPTTDDGISRNALHLIFI